MEAVDPTTERARPAAAAALPSRVALRRAREFGEEGLRFTDKVRLAYWNAFQHDCLNTAKAAAYSAIFALFPALIVAAALVAYLPYAAPLRYQLALFFERVLPSEIAPLLERYFIATKSLPESARVLLGTFVVSVTGAAGVLGTLMEGFRRAYGLKDECWGRGFRGQARRYAWSVLLVPISLLPMAGASVLVIFGHLLLPMLQHMTPTPLNRTLVVLETSARWAGAMVVSVSVMAAIYRFGLPVRPAWRRVLPGAAFATGTWFVTTLGFGWYVTHFANYSRVYGSLGTGVVLLLWLFLTALTVLCGAELNAELGRDA